ncbi:uncharacterized protein LOC130457176 [Monodelphis domestica]|uniref:uncharacterized protein LOC130457176 n=1 Tax=Monodelphis domestica TaxID=13616 RepID=UPI0024E20974|nr:uncharacterized protein LOC130457176 [Monodelphis domestica]
MGDRPGKRGAGWAAAGHGPSRSGGVRLGRLQAREPARLGALLPALGHPPASGCSGCSGPGRLVRCHRCRRHLTLASRRHRRHRRRRRRYSLRLRLRRRAFRPRLRRGARGELEMGRARAPVPQHFSAVLLGGVRPVANGRPEVQRVRIGAPESPEAVAESFLQMAENEISAGPSSEKNCLRISGAVQRCRGPGLHPRFACLLQGTETGCRSEKPRPSAPCSPRLARHAAPVPLPARQLWSLWLFPPAPGETRLLRP